jgi:F-type H+-transporting ATPase subunit epsilon
MTPDCVFLNKDADELILPTSIGSIGILDNHAPLLTAIEIGPLLFREQSNWTSFALIGGFALVQKNTVTVLVNEAVSASEIELREADAALSRATDRLNQAIGEKEKIEATFSFKRARARYQVLQLEKLPTLY